MHFIIDKYHLSALQYILYEWWDSNPQISGSKPAAYAKFGYTRIFLFSVEWQLGHNIIRFINSLLKWLPSTWWSSNGISWPCHSVSLHFSQHFSLYPSRINFFFSRCEFIVLPLKQYVSASFLSKLLPLLYADPTKWTKLMLKSKDCPQGGTRTHTSFDTRFLVWLGYPITTLEEIL